MIKTLLNILLAINLCEIKVHVHSALTQEQGKLSKHPVLLVVSYDGFRYDYMTKTYLPHLQGIMAEGVSVPYMEPQFPSKTFPNQQSIATGLYPESHGVTDNSFYEPELNRVLSGFVSKDEQLYNYRDDVLPIWIRNEQAGDGRISGCYRWSGGSTKYGNDSTLLPTYVIPEYNGGSVSWENGVQTVISWLTNDEKPANMVFLYNEQPDNAGHEFGVESNELLAEIQKTDNRTGYLVDELKKAGIYDDINLIIVSDHGMATVTHDRIINVTAMIDPTLYTRYSSSPNYQIQPKEPKDSKLIYETFKNKSEEGPGFKIYKKSELVSWKYSNNRRIRDFILLADEGYAFDDILSNNKRSIFGVHGYDNRVVSMRAFFLARGPHFKQGYASPTPIANIDLFPLFSKISGIPEAPNNGTLDTVSQFLSENPRNRTGSAGVDDNTSVSTAFIIAVCIGVVFGLTCIGFGLVLLLRNKIKKFSPNPISDNL